MRASQRKAIGFFAGVAASAGVYDNARPRVLVTNDSRETLANVVLTGKGFQVPMGSIAPGESACAAVLPTGESDLLLSFAVAGAPMSRSGLAYLEPRTRTRVHVSVGRNFNTRVEYQLLIPNWCTG